MTDYGSISPQIIGAIAGILACLVFLVFHQLTISNIWFSSPFMLLISSGAGALIVSSYFRLFEEYSVKNWFLYNTYYILGLGLLALLSVMIFKPKYTSDYILNLGGAPPPDLITGALPLTILWLILSSVLIVLLKSAEFSTLPIVLGTSASLYLTLGLNISILGKVEVSPQHQYLVEKFLLMNVMLGVLFLTFYAVIQYFIPTSSGTA